jgi:hypothetical protein
MISEDELGDHDRFTEGAAAPVPETEIEGVNVELLEMVIVALAAPEAVGVNVTLSVVD